MPNLRELLLECPAPTVTDIRNATALDLARLVQDDRLSVIRDLDILQNCIDDTLDRGTRRSRVLAIQTSRTLDPALLEVERRHGHVNALGRHFGVIDGPPHPAYASVAKDSDLHERAVSVPFRAHIYDNVGYVSLNFDDASDGAYQILHPGLLDDLHRLFTVLWLRSLPRYEPPAAENPLVLVRLLDAGLTDEAAAQRLGVSLRTYRRRIAELFQALGVNSRFAAGRVAERRGLVDLAAVVDMRLIDGQ